MSGIELQIGANVQPAIDGVNSVTKVLQDFASKGKLSIEVVENSMQDLKTAIKTSSDPAVVAKLKSAYSELNDTLKKLKIDAGLEQQIGGISRSTKLAHNDIAQLVGSLDSFSRGSSGAVEGVSNLILTFEKLKGETGGTKSAIGALAEAFLSPAGLVLAIGAAIPLIIEVVEKFEEMGDGSENTKEKIDALTESLKKQKQLLEGFNDDLDQATQIRKLKIDIETPQGLQRTIKDLNADLDAANLKVTQTSASLKVWQSDLDALKKKNDDVTKSAEASGATLSKSGKALVESNKKQIELLQKQIDDGTKDLKKAAGDVEAIPFKIKLAQTDDARDEAKRAADKLAKELEDALKAAIDNSHIKPILQSAFAHIAPLKPKIDLEPNFNITGSFSTLQDKLIPSPEKFAKSFKRLFDQFDNGDFGQKLKASIDIGGLEKLQNLKPGALGGISKEIATSATLLNNTLTPAIESMFQAFATGQNAMKALFSSLKQAVVQLLTQLVKEAAEAAILSIFIPGAGSFSSLFSKLAIPKFATGGIV